MTRKTKKIDKRPLRELCWSISVGLLTAGHFWETDALSVITKYTYCSPTHNKNFTGKMQGAKKNSSNVCWLWWFSCCFSAIMKVYDDFFLYKEGIYRHSQKAGSKWKTHSVKLLGWVKHILLPFFSACHECNKISTTSLEPKDLTVPDGTLLAPNMRLLLFHFCLVWEF